GEERDRRGAFERSGDVDDDVWSIGDEVGEGDELAVAFAPGDVDETRFVVDEGRVDARPPIFLELRDEVEDGAARCGVSGSPVADEGEVPRVRWPGGVAHQIQHRRRTADRWAVYELARTHRVDTVEVGVF